MIYFDDSDIILQKVLSTKIVDALKSTLAKLSKAAEKVALELKSVEQALANSKSMQEISLLSSKHKELKNKLIAALAIKNRVDVLLGKNNERIDYFNEKLKESGIYVERYDKKALSDAETSELDNLSEEEINLNPGLKRRKKMRFILGERLLFVDGGLSFENNHNREVLKTLSLETLTKLIEMYPSCASTVPDDMLLDSKVKQTVLKAITSYVSDGIKVRSIKNINRELGGLLSFKTEITQNATDYMAGVQNMYDVVCRTQLIEMYPEKIQEIADKLKCNDRSELVPPSKKPPVLAEGMAGDIVKTEEQESEDLRIEQEKEDFIQDMIANMYEEIFGEEEEELELEQEELEETKKESEIQEKMNKEKQEKEEEEEQLEEVQQMLRSYTKHDD